MRAIEHSCPEECTREGIELLQAENEKLRAAVRWIARYLPDAEQLREDGYASMYLDEAEALALAAALEALDGAR